MTLGYTPACTDRMHTARGTLTTLLPVAAAAPDTKAMVPAQGCTGVGGHRNTVQQQPHSRGQGLPPSPLAAADTSELAAQGSACSLRMAKHTWLHAGVPPHGLLGSGVYCEIAPNDEAGSCCSTHHALQQSPNELGEGSSLREPA